ncbi:ParH-like protein [Streptomyces sp. NPDC059679]|uniref:ParH-like protein n=1 Tax=Streptomyces sp. NPDC059679 TaxID=3346903 RepID=UPI00369A42EE
MNRARLWWRSRRVADGLELPSPFDPAAFVALLAERRGRPIELLPVTVRHSLPCGLLATTDRADYILYAADTTALHRQHIVLHETAHLLWGHDGTADPASLGLLTPHLSGSLVRRVLGRTVYTQPQEQEAEFLASLILQRALRNDRGPSTSSPGQAPLGSLVGAPPERLVPPGGRGAPPGGRAGTAPTPKPDHGHG